MSNMSMAWHVNGGLSVEWMFPENGGSITLVDDRGISLTLYVPPATWWMLYCNLPRATGFRVARKNGESITAPTEISEFLLSLLEQRRG
jgi:hypothetical protein